MQNIIAKEIKESAEFKPFFDAIAVIISAMKKQDSRVTGTVKLPKDTNWNAVSNYGITVQFWFEHNFGNEYGITAEVA